MFNFTLIVVAKIIKPEAVLFRVDDCAQLCLQASALRGVQQALEHRALDALPIVDTLLCHLPQTLPACGILRVDIIGD